ncbi:GNAT family N-acetyltransferase [Marininema halotolerans]|uniref:Predicted N-acyltransferase, GNAT family n=1 Tax=Marininema halotolerans TaxID=1155944 RepID=A0A1I6USR0_9BACL|nr:GNAT family N-acetyltransferase [Marininema halotolerans]SFT04491.1 Predicted N-acyltransferase, GNAT family [Marininema halotolerans]
MAIQVSLITDQASLDQAFTIRKKVFVEEQGVPLSLEIDEYEEVAIHFIARIQDRPVGTLRLRWLTEEKDLGKVERVAVLSSYRGARVGIALMHAVEDYAMQKEAHRLKLSAQLSAAPFYTKLGYQQFGSTYMDAGIEHISMDKHLPAGKV